MFDVITFGSATKDIFLQAKETTVISGKDFRTGEGLCFPLGSKVMVDDIYFTSGGGGTNSAVTFAKQGHNVAYCGKVGDDNAGEGVLKDLERYGVSNRFVTRTKEKPTNHSIILDVPERDRTILVYRGASDLHEKKDVPLQELEAKWFYLAPFSDHSQPLFFDLLDYAREKGIGLMANPSKVQLKNEKTREALKNIDMVLLNMEEASILTGISIENENEIIKKSSGYAKEAVLITKGVEGAVAYSKGKYFESRPIFPDSTDKTGAGDAFGSGFLSRFIETGSVEKGVQFGIANATACLQKKGAKHGILRKGEEFHMSPIEEISL